MNRHFAIASCAVLFLLLAPLPAEAQTTWFTFKGNPVVDHGPAGSWDQAMVLASRVMFKDSLYHMWYLGGVSGSSPRIGYATSRDGVTWSKHSSNPVLNADQVWESGGVVFAYVIYEDSLYRMWYQGASQPYRFGYATSSDGVHWTKYSANPVFGPVSWISTTEGVYYPCVIPDTGRTYHMWFGANQQIGYAHGSGPTAWVPTAAPVSPYGRFPRVLSKSGGGYEMWHNGGYETSPNGINWTNQKSNLTSLGSLHYNPLFDGAIYHLWYASGAIFQERVNYAVSPKGFRSTVEPSDSNGNVFAAIDDSIRITVHIDSPDQRLSFVADIDSAYPGPHVDTLRLYDDGVHGDLLKGDGLFANRWRARTNGTYLVGMNLILNDTLRFNEIEFVNYFVVPVVESGVEVPTTCALEQNYPNPFNPSTRIKYTVGVASGRGQVAGVKLVVYDLLGREVAVLVNEKKAPGSYEVTFDGSGLSSGVYLYRMEAGSYVQARKLVILK